MFVSLSLPVIKKGATVLVVNATDLDASREFGQASLIYSLEGSSQFRLNSRSGSLTSQNKTFTAFQPAGVCLNPLFLKLFSWLIVEHWLWKPWSRFFSCFWNVLPLINCQFLHLCFRGTHNHSPAGQRAEVGVHPDSESCGWRSWPSAEDWHCHRKNL